MHHERNRAEARSAATAYQQDKKQQSRHHNYYASDGRKMVLDIEEEVHVDNERDVITLMSEAERGPWANEEGVTHVYTCDTKLGDRRLEDEALNDAEQDDADLTHMYTHVSELADDADDAKDEELADGEDEDEDDSEDEDDNNKLEEVMDTDLIPARISELGNEEELRDEDDMENEDINDIEGDGNDDRPDDLMRVKRYLSTLRRPDGITDRAFGALR